jgi:hypothetical protein
LVELAQNGEESISLTDPDSKRMRYSRNREGLVGYNVQVAVDAKHGLIAAQDVVTSANDLNELSRMAAAAQEMLRPEGSVPEGSVPEGSVPEGSVPEGSVPHGSVPHGSVPHDSGAATEVGGTVALESSTEVRPLKVLADNGYFNADELMACEQLAVETYVSCRKTTSGKSKDGVQVFPKESFLYDETNNAYVCPGNQLLTFQGERLHRGDLFFVYRTNACTGCALKPQCTQARYRTIHRRDTQAASDRARRRAELHPEMRLTRQGTVEKIFGSFRLGGHDKFLTRGLKKVRAEFSLSSISYNIKRIIQILGVQELTQRLQAV